jgi:hypothetical protein
MVLAQISLTADTATIERLTVECRQACMYTNTYIPDYFEIQKVSM